MPACVTVFVLPPSVVVVALASALATTTDDDDDDVEFLFGYLRSAFFGPPFRRVAFVSLKALPLLDGSSVVGAAFVDDVATNAILVVVVVVVDAHMLFLSLSLFLLLLLKEVEEERSDGVCAFPFLCRKWNETDLFFDLSTKNEMKP